jgi:hypothetical protein
LTWQLREVGGWGNCSILVEKHEIFRVAVQAGGIHLAWDLEVNTFQVFTVHREEEARAALDGLWSLESAP